jgi:hypothetical protein
MTVAMQAVIRAVMPVVMLRTLVATLAALRLMMLRWVLQCRA